ncbi:MAG TPA: class I lanthipeptide [Thermoanaerobaculia bacterium]|nr:class I lanthipeptide [Thermoanaerobaculia bacterium]
MVKREQLRLKKLTLNRETIAVLTEAELAKVQGGQMNTGDTYGCGNSAGCTGVFCG